MSALSSFPAYFTQSPQAQLDRIAKGALVTAIFFMPLGGTPAYVFMLVMGLMWVLAGGYGARWAAIKDNTIAWSALILYLLLAVGTLYSSGAPEDVGTELRKYSKLLFMLPAFTLLTDATWRNRAINAFCLAMLITLVCSMVSVVWPLSFMKGFNGNHYVFKDHIIQNLMMAFFVLIMMLRAAQNPKPFARAIYAIIALAGMVNILGFVGGRTGHLALLAIIAVFILSYVPTRLRWIFFIVAIVGVLGVFQFSDNIRSRVEQTITEFSKRDSEPTTSVGQRVEYAKKSVQLIQERPIFGWGTGAYPTQYCRVASTPDLCQLGRVHPHNQFLGFGVQLGLVGIFAYLAFMGTALIRASRYPLNDRVMGYGLLAALLVDSMTHAPLFLVGEAQFFTMMMVAIFSLRPADALAAQARS